MPERIKYIRVSTKNQNEDRQLVDQDSFDRVFIEKQSGKNMARPVLREMLNYVRKGDIVEVESYSRLARNTKDLLDIVDTLTKKGVTLVSQKEQVNTSSAEGRLMLGFFAALSQFEREVMLERQAEGIAVAKAQGKQLGRPEREMDEAFYEAVKLWREGTISAVEAMKRSKVNKSTFYYKVKQLKL